MLRHKDMLCTSLGNKAKTYPLTDLFGGFHGAAEVAGLASGFTMLSLKVVELLHDPLFVSLEVRAISMQIKYKPR